MWPTCHGENAANIITQAGINMFIAEIGINHNGDIDLAKKLINMAKKAGADVVKFQKRDVDTCVPANMKNVIKHTPWGDMKYIEYKRKLEFSKNEYSVIDAYCKTVGIKWAASVWDIQSLEFITSYNVPFIKIPSACITDIELVKKTSRINKPVIISTGMSTFPEIRRCVRLLSKCDLTILHCNSSYPADEHELDLNVIGMFKKLFTGHKIGYSGHENGIYASIVAKALGAEVIERHITLDKKMWGTDQAASLDYDELSRLICVLEKIPIWLGKNHVHIYDSELLAKEKLRRKFSISPTP